jgi:hypothetical protein
MKHSQHSNDFGSAETLDFIGAEVKTHHLDHLEPR